MEGKAYIIGGCRSYIGIENSMYRHVPAEKLGAATLKKVMSQTAIDASDVDCIIAGNGVGAGGNIARLMTLEAGVPVDIPAFTVDMQCGSALESISIAAAKIAAGQADVVIAGGFESSSTAPRRGYSRNHPDYDKYGEDSWYRVAKFVPGEHNETAMLQGAENTAVSENISKEHMDRWVFRSHRLARETREKGILDDLIVEVMPGCNKDEGIRNRMSQRLLDRLPCVLKEGQVINAANACLTNDGAAFIVLCSQRYLDKHNITAMAEFVDIAEVGTNPDMSPKSCIAAVERLLNRNELTVDDIDIFECNEAFAVIDVLFERNYPSAVDRYNVFGGALAYGHPYGASGGIVTLHALKALEIRNGSLAVCSIAAAGGVGSAILIRRL